MNLNISFPSPQHEAGDWVWIRTDNTQGPWNQYRDKKARVLRTYYSVLLEVDVRGRSRTMDVHCAYVLQFEDDDMVYDRVKGVRLEPCDLRPFGVG